MKKSIIFFFLSVFLLTSCSDVLDKKPLDIISDDVVFSDQVLADDYLNQCYAEMVFAWETQYGGTTKQGTGFYTWFEQVGSITIADESRWGWVSAPKSNWIGSSGGHMEWWGYPTVRRLNVFIENVQSGSFSETYKKARLAEARFLRAFCYFNMVKRYGGVPLITRVQQLNDPEEEIYRERDKEADIYDFILSEIDAIVSDLPDAQSSSDAGRPSKYAALALKSRAAMYAGSIATWGTVQLNGLVGIPSSKASTYWQASYDASKAIITSAKFSLYNKYPTDKTKNFRNIFLDEGNSETIFSERFNGLSGKGHSYDMFMVPRTYHPWGVGQQTALYLEMIESFDNIDGTPGIIDRSKIASGYKWTVNEIFGNKDPRFKASVYTQGTSWRNGTVVLDYHDAMETPTGVTNVGSYKGVLCKSTAAASPTPFGVLKYLDEEERSVTMERNYSDTDYIVFRYGEILLNYAEAAVELNKFGDASWAINSLRTRAGMPTYGTVTRDQVRKERKVELAFEGNRYWDLRRWRNATTELSQAFHGLRFILDGSSFTQGAYNPATAKYKLTIVNTVDGTPTPYFADRHYYLPITNARIVKSKGNFVENPGYN